LASSPRSDVLRGTLDLLILKTLALEPMHGWGISQRIQQLSRDALQVGQGSLYPALQRLEERGLVESEWLEPKGTRRAKYYRLTTAGRRSLGEETATWRQYVRTVELILEAAGRSAT
jgi:PadR family transcriptional regulator PadR